MALTLPFAEATSVGSPALNIAIFAAFVVITLVIVIRVSSGKKTAEQYYTAAGAFTGRQNGVAIAGDYLSAASFLGIAGAIALQGYDGFLYSIGFLVAWLVALLLVAELMRNTGRFTMADVLSYRLQAAPGAHRDRDLGAHGVVLLPAGPDGRCRWPGLAAPRHPGRDGAEPRHRARRRHHDHLRAHRRDEGHHLGADHQGAAAHRRHRGHHPDGARQVQLQLLRALPVAPPTTPPPATSSSSPA